MGLSDFFNSKSMRSAIAGAAAIATLATGFGQVMSGPSAADKLDLFCDNAETICVEQDVVGFGVEEATAKVNAALDILQQSETGAELVRLAKDEGTMFVGSQNIEKGVVGYYMIGDNLVTFDPARETSDLADNFAHELAHHFQDELGMETDYVRGRLNLVDHMEYNLLKEAQAEAIASLVKYELQRNGAESNFNSDEWNLWGFMDQAFADGLAEAQQEKGLSGRDAELYATNAAYQSFFENENVMERYVERRVSNLVEFHAEDRLPHVEGRQLTTADRKMTTQLPGGESFTKDVPNALAANAVHQMPNYKMLLSELEAQRQGTNTDPALNAYSGVDFKKAAEIYRENDGQMMNGMLGAVQIANVEVQQARRLEMRNALVQQHAEGGAARITSPGNGPG